MTKVTQIDDRSATVAWSPIGSHADVIALGAKDSRSSGFDSYGSELEFFDLGITSSSSHECQPSVIGSIKTTSRFSSIAWTNNASNTSSFNLGMLAGGMDNGTIAIYNPSAIIQSNDNDTISNDDALLATIDRTTKGAITAISFNPHASSPCLLASGSGKGELLISSLDSDPTQPSIATPSEKGAEITSLAWNTEVSHIIASAGGNGMTTIWDLRQNQPWCELRCEISGSPVSCVRWNPSQGMHLLTSSADDRNPVIKLWDLRASMSMPLATTEGAYGGHEKGILSMDWCPFDESLLVSCGKDDKTFLWDLVSFRPICEIPKDDDSNQQPMNGGVGESTSHNIGSGLSTSQQKRYDVKWSPIRRGILSTCSFDRKVQAHSVLGLATKCGRPPKWMKPASGVSCGFGNSVTSFASTHKVVSMSTHVERPDLKIAVEEFEASVANGDYITHASKKQQEATTSGNSYEAQVWGFMQVIFDTDARAKLLLLLGFDSEKIKNKASDFVEEKKISEFDSTSKVHSMSVSMSDKAERAVNEALLVGNFEAAVDCCVSNGNLADALILASCGGAELWAKTQAQFFTSELQKRPFLSIVAAVIHNKLGEYVSSSDPAKWHETLAAICSYGTQEEFTTLCEALGDRLSTSGDMANASLCYMCSLNLGKASKYWQEQLEEKGDDDYMALHLFVEKVAVFTLARNNDTDIPEDVAETLFQYAKFLADEGLFASAAKYCRSEKQECKELQDRLYRSKDSQQCLTGLAGTPDFPFEFVNINVAPARTAKKSTTTSRVTSQHQNSHATKTQVASQSQKSAANKSVDTYQQQNRQQVAQQQHQQYGQQVSQQQQQQQQQQVAQQQQYGQTVSAPIQTHQESTQLAPGWVEYQDPTSGRAYYANTSTGETSWEKPVVQIQTATANQSTVASGPSNKIVSKYGDGFVTSASHPELGAQYGNVGTSNPYSSSRPGIAVVNKQIEKAPVSGTFNLQTLSQVADSTEHKETIDDLLSMVTSLSTLTLQGSEKKQVVEIEKGAAIFSKRLGKSDIDNEVVQKVGHIVSSMKNRDYATATSIHAGLVNSVWKENKDWLKGMKFLIQINSKRMY